MTATVAVLCCCMSAEDGCHNWAAAIDASSTAAAPINSCASGLHAQAANKPKSAATKHVATLSSNVCKSRAIIKSQRHKSSKGNQAL